MRAIAVLLAVVVFSPFFALAQDPRDVLGFTTPAATSSSAEQSVSRDVSPNPFANPGFEQGNFNGWSTVDIPSPFFPLQVSGSVKPAGANFTTGPLEGNYSAVTGFSGAGGDSIRIWQDVTFPQNAAYLTFDYRFATDMTVGDIFADGYFQVLIDQPGGGASYVEQFLIAKTPNDDVVRDTGVRTGRVNIRPYAGESRRVIFEWFVPPYFEGPGLAELDNIRVEGNELYAAASLVGFGTVNASTGLFTPFASFASIYYDSMAYDRNTDTLYAVQESPHRLVVIDQQDGSVQVIGTLSLAYIDGLAFDPNSNTLYGLRNDGALYVVDKVTAELTFIGFTGVAGPSGLAYDRFTDTLWMAQGGAIYRVNTETASVTLFMDLGFVNTTCLTFSDVDRGLYALHGTNDTLIRFDLDQATLSVIGSTGQSIEDFNGMAFKAPKMDSLLAGTANATGAFWMSKDGYMGDQLFEVSAVTAGMAYNRNTGNTYLTTSGGDFYEINPDGSSTYIGAPPTSVGGGLAYDPNSDTLYVTNGLDSLYTLDPETAETVLIGSAGGGFLGGLAFDRFTDTLYATDDSVSPARLLKLNVETGARTIIGSTSHDDLDALTFNEQDGYLYALEEFTSTLVRIDPATGASVFLRYARTASGTASFGGLAGLACVSEREPQLVELFDDDDNDLSNTRLTFVPDALDPEVYHTYREKATSWSAGPFTGTVLPLGDDAFQQINFTGGKTFEFYGQPYSGVFVGSNGYLTFGEGKSGLGESIINHYTTPRISALFDDLVPNSDVYYRQFWDRFVVSWVGVSEYYPPNTSNSFQIELFYGGAIRITYLEVEALDGLAGLSSGDGVPPRFVEGDLNNAKPFAPDTDGDGFQDFYEMQLNLDAIGGDNDKDDDGLSDAEEFFTHGTNMYVADTDGDGLDDGEEINAWSTNPFVADSDGDGASDGEEVDVGTNPNNPGSKPDPATWVDFTYSGTQNGSYLKPYKLLVTARVNTAPLGKIRIKAGSTSETIFINKALTFESIGGTTVIGVNP